MNISKEIPIRFNINEWNDDLNINTARSNLRRLIFKLKLLPIQCNNCKLDKWLNKEIPLELNHINGNGHDNRKSNIELLCPNCHALTETYRGKNVVLKYGKAKKKPYDKEKQIKYNKKRSDKKDKKPNKWHSYDRTREEYLIQLEEKRKLERKEKIEIILNSNTDFTKPGWRLLLSKILNMTPQWSGRFVQHYIPELWEKCSKHQK